MTFIVALSHIWILSDLQGEPCEVCPVLPVDLGTPVALQGKRGPKGEPGSPGVGETGLPVSATVKRQLFSSRDACQGSAPDNSGWNSNLEGDILFLIILFTSRLRLCTSFTF